MVEPYGLTFADAEKAKITGNLPVDCDVDVIDPFITSTVNQLRMDLRMFSKVPNSIKIEKAILMGGGLLMKDLVAHIGTELDLNVEVASLFNGFNYQNKADETLMRTEGAKYILALGLALRGGK